MTHPGVPCVQQGRRRSLARLVPKFIYEVKGVKLFSGTRLSLPLSEIRNCVFLRSSSSTASRAEVSLTHRSCFTGAG